MIAKGTAIAIMGVLVFGSSVLSHPATPAHASVIWNDGDIFVGVGGKYNVYDSNGVFKQTVDTGLTPVRGWTTVTTGCAFNPKKSQLYATNWTDGTEATLDTTDPHAKTTIDPSSNIPGGHYESIVFAANGDYYLGNSEGSHQILWYSANNTFRGAFTAEVEDKGTDWIDLSQDQKTLFYDSEGNRIMRYNVAKGTQLPDFSVLPDDGGQHKAYALRLLPPGDGSGGLLVADKEDIKQLDGTGKIIQTYQIPGEDNLFALNLDPDGQHFWTGDYATQRIFEFELGKPKFVKEIDPQAGAPGVLGGICIKGELTAAIPALSFSKSVNKAIARPGDPLTYTLSYKNIGETTAYNVTLTDPLPAGTTYASSTDNPSINNSTLTFTIDSVPPGANGSVSFDVTTDSSANNATITNTATLTATGLPAPLTSSATTKLIVAKLYFDSDTWIGNKSVTDGGSVGIGDEAVVTAGGKITSGKWLSVPDYNSPTTGQTAWQDAEDTLIAATRAAFINSNNQLPAADQLCSSTPLHLTSLYLKHGIDPFTGEPIPNYVANASPNDPYILFQFADPLNPPGPGGCTYTIDKGTTIYGTGTIVSTDHDALINWQPGSQLPGATWQIMGTPQFADQNDTLGIVNFGNAPGKKSPANGTVEIGSGVSLNNIAIFSDNITIDANQSNANEYLAIKAIGRHITFPNGNDLFHDIHFQNSSTVAANIPPLFRNFVLPNGRDAP